MADHQTTILPRTQLPPAHIGQDIVPLAFNAALQQSKATSRRLRRILLLEAFADAACSS